MPLFYQHNINDTTKLAVWHITEPEDFFLEKVPLKRDIIHWHKRLQHLAGRYLLQELFPDFPYHLIEIADTRKPFLPNEEYHFSISHCGDYAAVIVSKDKRVGIDVELVTPKIDLVKNRFLKDEELELVAGYQLPEANNKYFYFVTLLWSCKEAVFKWNGEGGISFKNHINIKKISGNDSQGIIDCKFLKDQDMDLIINFQLFQNTCLAWVIE